MKLIDFLSDCSVQTDDIVPELVLIKMNDGEFFCINNRQIVMKSMHKYNGKLSHIEFSAKLGISGITKTIYIWKIGSVYQLHGIDGKGNKHDWLHNLLRDIEGKLVCDILNLNNPLHEFSDVYKIYNR